MNNETQVSFYKRLKIGFKLAMIPMIFIVAMVSIISYVVIAQQTQRTYAQMIEKAGRQRTINQWYAKDLILASLHQKNDYKYWRQTLLESLDALQKGGQIVDKLEQKERVPIEAAPTQAIFDSFNQLRNQAQEMQANEAPFLALSPKDPRYPEMLQKIGDISRKLHDLTRETVDLYTRYAEEQSDQLTHNVIGIGLIVSLLGLLLNWLISKGISTPLIRLAQRSEAVATGTLSGESLPVTSLDEVGQLTTAFNLMTENLREMIQQNIQSAKELGVSTSEILASSQQQSASTQEQVTAIQETSATMEEVRQSGSQISERARQVAAEAENAVNMTENGLKSVQLTVNTMQNIGHQVNEVAENIVNLSEKNRAVGDIVALVTEIAEQSNLLALNAAIEAAAAGDQGRSFTVVANEMKHLANQAKDATTQVRLILEDIQKGITKAVMLTEEAVKKVEGGRQQTDISENTIRNMAEATQQSIQAFQQIVAATNQQQLGLEQIFQALQDIRQSSEQTASGTVQLNKASSNLNSMSQQLQRLVSRYTL